MTEPTQKSTQASPEKLLEQGNWYQQHNALPQALEVYEKMQSLGMHYIEQYCNMAYIHSKLGDLIAMDKSIQQCLALSSNLPEAYQFLAQLYSGARRDAKAKAVLDLGLRLYPEHPGLLQASANAYRDCGDHEQARKLYREVLQLKPDHAESAYGFATAKHDDNVDQTAVDLLESMLNQQSLNERQQALLYFGLARIFDNAKDYDRAFTYLTKANRLWRSQITFEPERFIESQQNLFQVFNSNFINEHHKRAKIDSTVIYIVGMPRSGTSLTERILSSHSQVFAGGEYPSLENGVEYCPPVRRSGKIFPEAITQLTDTELDNLAARLETYMQALPEEPVTYITNKMPGNFMYLGFLAALYKKVKIIYCQRDAMDVCLSNYFQVYQERYEFCYNLEELAFVYNHHEKMIKHWQENLPIDIYTMNYEKLVNNFEQQARELIDYVELPWDDNCLAFYRQKTQMMTASHWQVQQPIYQSSVGRWRHYEQHLACLQRILQRG